MDVKSREEIIDFAQKLNSTNLSPLRSGNISVRGIEDGIDGFFSFQVLLALIGLAIIGRAGFTLAHLSLVAALLPYSLMNLGLFGKKFKVFIGDHGAMMIGFFLACSFIFLTQDPVNEYESHARPVEALLCVGLVLLNALRVIWKRFIKSKIY